MFDDVTGVKTCYTISKGKDKCKI